MIQNGKVLLVQRAKEPWAGAWCAPGGFCDAGEHPIETVEREALEETGLRVAVTGYIGVWVDEYADDEAAPSVEIINVAYYTAVPLGGPERPFDKSEVRERSLVREGRAPAVARSSPHAVRRPRRRERADADPRSPYGGSHAPELTASRDRSSSPPGSHWSPAGSRFHDVWRYRYAAHMFRRT